MTHALAALAGKRILITGHTGFKGAWLSQWMVDAGAKVCGIGLPARTGPCLFRQLDLASHMENHEADIRDAEAVKKVVSNFQPELVFHLAAQALARPAFTNPVETFSVNVQGTVNVLDALREVAIPCGAVMVTSDRCYENHEWNVGYREEDALGGADPYSASKAAAEIAISAYRRSYFDPEKIIVNDLSTPQVGIASARSGNVIGGGDWASDRLIPEAVKALTRGAVIPVRNPRSVRPWQHVLEPLAGYVILGVALQQSVQERKYDLRGLASPFNFGTHMGSSQSARVLIDEFLKYWPGTWEDRTDPKGPPEAGQLLLNSEKAMKLLDWSPKWDFKQAVERTAEWYRSSLAAPLRARDLVRADIAAYVQAPALTASGS